MVLGNVAYLFDNEPRINDQGKVENGKHQEGLPSKIVDGVWSGLRKDKIEQPLRRSADGDTHFTGTVRENLTRVQPRNWTE